MVASGFKLSEKFQIPVLLRPGIRICHARQAVNLPRPKKADQQAEFVRNPGRWAATPRFRYVLHKELNDKLRKIARLNEKSPFNRLSFKLEGDYPLGVLAAGAPAAALADILADAGLSEKTPVLTLGAPYPFPEGLVNNFLSRCRQVLVLEETDLFIELLAPKREKLLGRLSGHVPGEGELTPEVINEVFRRSQKSAGQKPIKPLAGRSYAKILGELKLPIMKPRLCAGCGHRPAFYAIRQAFPKAIFPSDIGCYTLGLNLRAVDTVLDMGSGITLASGLYQALKRDGPDEDAPVIVATIGDSTFFHSGTASLVNAVYNDARFVLVVLDNQTTAMTGMQPTPDLGIRADGLEGKRVDMERLIRGCGVDHVVKVAAYDIPAVIAAVKEAHEQASKPDGGPAVVIAAHPCRIAYPDEHPRLPVVVNDECDGCGICTALFECPAMSVPVKGEKVRIDPKLCVECGVCVHVCPNGALEVADAS